jgi:DNA-binding NarL/FixJ family response regulator
MDVRMPHVDGIEATRRIVAAMPSTKVVILTTFDLDEYAFAGLKAGASGFLLKDVLPADLVAGIRIVAGGDAVIAPSTTRRLVDAYLRPASVRGAPTGPPDRLLDQLTERERGVFLEIAAGLSNAEIAAKLTLSEATVKTHVGHVFAKLGLRDRVQAVIFAYENGITAHSP